MENGKTVSRNKDKWIFIFMGLAWLAVDGIAAWLLAFSRTRLATMAQLQPPVVNMDAMAPHLKTAGCVFWTYFVPGSALFFFLLALFLWLVVRRGGDGETAAPPATSPRPGKRPPEQAAVGEPDKDTQVRTYLHLITVLQREGRLVDFFFEDLVQYPDAQIGAAVREIHEKCRQVLRKSLSPQSVLDNDEGAEITIEADFDPNAYKLVGDVTGEPPFKGVVRHRGWRAGKVALPSFTGRQAPEIIAPAVIEVGGH